MCLTVTACSDSKATSLKKQFNNDTHYFMALRAMENNDERTAIRLFSTSSVKSNPKIARLAAVNLTKLGNVTERNKAAALLADKYGDDEALLIAAKVFFEQGEYSTVLSISDAADINTAPNQLIFYRISSLYKKNDSRLKDELFNWFTCRPVSSYHSDFYGEYLKSIDDETNKALALSKDVESITDDETAGTVMDHTQIGFKNRITPEAAKVHPAAAPELPAEIQIMNYRLLIYNKKYKIAFNESDNILSLYSSMDKLPHYQLVSDMGKAALYGTDDFKLSAQKFDRMALTYSKNSLSVPGTNAADEAAELAYCAYFYAARLYDRAGRFQDLTVLRYNSALEATKDRKRFDDALWYLLNMQLRMSTDDIIVTLKKYTGRISNPQYFDDFFDNFSVLLLSHGKWQDFYDVWKLIDGSVSEETACKFAYISGRILEEGYGNTNGTPKTKEAVNAYSRVLSGNASTYYKVSALERMNIVDKTYVTDVLCSGGPEIKRNINPDSQKLIAGYAAFGFPQNVYSQWLASKDELNMDNHIQAIRFLNQCGSFDNDYSVQSLRIAARTKTMWSGKIPYELLELNYPRFYSSFVTKACIENKISEPLLYALIRSESFFDASISSKAGASGLTQLMRPTADDEARKLKLGENYNILDPETNIKMGSHYLAGLIERTEGKSELLALFAYNAGLTNVRKWKRPAGMSMDLFLETLPFPETREYGRKLVSAAAMYGFLYYDITPAETVRKMMK